MDNLRIEELASDFETLAWYLDGTSNKKIQFEQVCRNFLASVKVESNDYFIETVQKIIRKLTRDARIPSTPISTLAVEFYKNWFEY